jgi:hypothetical protein
MAVRAAPNSLICARRSARSGCRGEVNTRRAARGRTEYRTGWPVTVRVMLLFVTHPSSPRARPPRQADCLRLSRWHAECLRLCEVNAIDYRAIQLTCLGSPRAADHPGILVTTPSEQVIRLPAPGAPGCRHRGAPGLPQFQHPPGSASCWPPLICLCRLPHSYSYRPVPRGLPQQPRAQIRRPGDGQRWHGARPLRTASGHGVPADARTWRGARRTAPIHRRDRRSVRGRCERACGPAVAHSAPRCSGDTGPAWSRGMPGRHGQVTAGDQATCA